MNQKKIEDHDELMKSRFHYKKPQKKQIDIRKLSDITNVIKDILSDKDSGGVNVSEQLVNYRNDDGKDVLEKVTIENRDLSIYTLLIEGLKLVKNRLDLSMTIKNQLETVDEDNDLLPEKIKWNLFDIDSQKFNVDLLIKKELGGYRKGLKIRWDIEEGTFEYDVFENKLYKVEE